MLFSLQSMQDLSRFNEEKVRCNGAKAMAEELKATCQQYSQIKPHCVHGLLD